MNVKYVMGNDWCGMYLDNCLVEEGHSISLSEGLKILGENWNGEGTLNFFNFTINDEWLEEEGSFPKTFTEIPSKMLTIA